MLISTKTKYGLRALIDLIINYKDKPIYLKDIAKRQLIPLRYLENIFRKLKQEGIINSYKGKYGGFVPAKKPSEISLYDLTRVLENNKSISECISEPYKCNFVSNCKARSLWIHIENGINKTFHSITIDSLI